MAEYGVLPTGFSRKPLATIKAEIEARMRTQFGPDVIVSPQSPLGQQIGLLADLTAEVWEIFEDIYQSYDPAQAEGERLDSLALLRLIDRNQRSDDAVRQAITNEGVARIDVQDLARAVQNVPGVTYGQVFVNETGEITPDGLASGSVAVAVIGGEDEEIASALRTFIVPGVSTYGNSYISVLEDGYCRSMAIIRPIEIDVSLTLRVNRQPDRNGCPPPSFVAISDALEAVWADTRINGLDVTFYTVRKIIEGLFTGVEVVSVQGSRDGIDSAINEAVDIAFIEIASLDVTVEDA